MAEIIQEEKGKGGKKTAKKHPPRTDGGPYVSADHILYANNSLQQVEGYGDYSARKNPE
jgi:hypothetical protein